MGGDDSALLTLLRRELDSAAFVRFDERGVIVDISDSFSHLLGDDSPASVPADMRDLWVRLRTLLTPDPGDLSVFLGHSGDRDFRVQGAVPAAGRAVRLTARPLPDNADTVLLLQQQDDQQAVDELQQINTLLANTLNQLPIGLAVVDTRRRVMHASDAALAIVGRRREEVVGKSTRLMYPDDKTFRELNETLYPANQQRVRTRALHSHGTLRDVEITMLPLSDDAGEPVAFVALIEDLTQEEALVSELERFQEIVEASSDGLVFIDRDYRYRGANRSYLALWGRRPEEVVGRPVREVVGDVMFDETIKPRLDACLSGERPVQRFEDLLPTAPADRQYIEVTYTAHRANGGTVDGVVVNVRNITERFLGQQALQREIDHHMALLKLQSILLDNLPALVFIKDLDNNILQVTQCVAELTGLPRDRIEGRPSAEIYPDMAERYHADDRAVIESGQPQRGIIEPLPTAGGDTAWLLTDKIPYRDESGAIVGIIVCSLDITDLRRSQFALQESERRYRTLFELIPQGVVVHDTTGRITTVNPAACLILGRSREEILGLTSRAGAWDVIREDGSDFPGHEHPAMEVLRTGKTVRGTVMGVFNPERQDRVWLRVDAVPLSEPGSDLASGVFASFSDITESRQLQQVLIQGQRMEAIGRLAGGVAHDFNNILGSVLGFAELAGLLVGDDQEKLRLYLAQIETAGLRARDLVRQLLVYARGELRATGERFAVMPVVDECVSLLRTLLPAKVAIRCDPPAQPPALLMDPLHLHQILMNLGVNAGDAMPNGGTLTIAVDTANYDKAVCRVTQQRVSGQWLRIRVTDKGSGIPDDIVDKVFEPFFTTKEVGKGSGMGLAVVAGLVAGYKGHVLVSAARGGGTCFAVLLPPVEDSTDRASANTATPTGGSLT
jgi:PAS domain S-box-containing protein